MDCTLSAPQTYDGSTPVSGADYWQFSQMNCQITPVPTATPSAQQVASSSGTQYIDIASSSALAQGLTGAIEVNYAFDILMLIAAAIAIGVWAFSHG